ncbi:two component transcriptional regulator, LuxR family [Vibrio hangzhouensis]|uniref:Two component transcriptional regulator, LuxR family n=2 Tax=Vibrio hangzhouensis TaxID=462991 RepID=A0A1H5TLQ3_9VIBR|nr:two component transcriptional regulator, LuxR family [Vibrio hangzhouensis]
MKKKTLILADDHVLVAQGIKNILSEDYEILCCVENGRDLVQKAKELKPDVIVSDISMPMLNGIEAMSKLREYGVESKVVLLTMHPEVKYAIRALDAGASGYVLKHSATDELLTAIKTALSGRTFITSLLAADVMEAYKKGASSDNMDPLAQLSPRQLEVLQLLSEGKTAKEVARIMNISSRTVEFHKYKMIEILKLKNGRELLKFALDNGLGDALPRVD